MVDPGREDDEISGEALNPNPAILDVSHVEVTGAADNESVTNLVS